MVLSMVSAPASPRVTLPESPLSVWSRGLMVHSSHRNGGMRYGPSSSWERPHDSGGASRDPAESSELEGAGQAPRPQPEDRRKVEEAPLGPGRAHWPQGAALDRALDRGGGHHCRLSAAHAAAAG